MEGYTLSLRTSRLLSSGNADYRCYFVITHTVHDIELEERGVGIRDRWREMGFRRRKTTEG